VLTPDYGLSKEENIFLNKPVWIITIHGLMKVAVVASEIFSFSNGLFCDGNSPKVDKIFVY
jgi:hypothetical protein